MINKQIVCWQLFSVQTTSGLFFENCSEVFEKLKFKAPVCSLMFAQYFQPVLHLYYYIVSGIFRPLVRPVYRLGTQTLAPEKHFKFSFFSCISKKKRKKKPLKQRSMISQSILIISKWVRIQKWRQKRKTMRHRGRSERRNCQQMCFHSFNYVVVFASINYTSIRFSFYVNSLHCFVWFFLHYLLYLLFPDRFAALTCL